MNEQFIYTLLKVLERLGGNILLVNCVRREIQLNAVLPTSVFAKNPNLLHGAAKRKMGQNSKFIADPLK